MFIFALIAYLYQYEIPHTYYIMTEILYFSPYKIMLASEYPIVAPHTGSYLYYM